MKRTIKIIVSVIGGLVILALIGGLYIWSTLPKLDQDRITLSHGIIDVNIGFSYAWLIPTEKGILLIDTGHDKEGKAIIAELNQQGLSANDVHTIILTHGHTDHWGGTAAFPQATIYIHEADVPLLNGEMDEASNPLLAFFQRQMTQSLIPPSVYQTIGGNQRLEIDGEQFEIFLIPGHTPGSIAILWRDILFLGDSVQKGEAGIEAAPQMFSDNWTQIKQSLTPLLQVEFTTIAVAHSDVIENGRQQLQQFLDPK